MKTRIVLSTKTDKGNVPDWQQSLFVSDQAARCCASYNVSANVVPLTSSISDDGVFRIEHGADITVLSDETPDRIIALFNRLKDIFGLGCVWLEREETSYKGCILEWQPMIDYRASHNLDPLTCADV